MDKEKLMEMGLEEEMAERVEKAFAQALSAARLEAALDCLLLKNGARCLPAVKALVRMEEAKLLEDGTVEGLQEQIDALRANAETAFLFDRGEVRIAGVELGEGMDRGTDTGPAGMSYAELCSYLEAHPEARL